MISPNSQAEQALVGAIMMQPETVLPKAVLKLREEDFYIPEYRNLFAACKALYSAEQPVDAVTVVNKLGPAYKVVIVHACEAAPTVRHFESYLAIVLETSRRLKAYERALDLENALAEGEPLDVCQQAAVKASEMLNETDDTRVFSAKELFFQFYKTKMKQKKYLTTGIGKLDQYAYIDRGDYVVVGARPSAGKTALTLQMMLHMAKTVNVVYFSLETSGAKLADRMVANLSATPLSQIKTGKIKDWTKVSRIADPFRNLKFHVAEAAGWTVAQIHAKAVQLRADVIFVDYLSLIKSDGKSLYERVSKISMDLHTLAQQSKITVIALSQLNREAKGGVLDMAQLRESGQIEQDADIILLLQETDREQQNSDRRLIIAKNKEGSTGYITLSFLGEFQRFYELQEE